ncbi:hypothetical protein CRG98_011147 [Punica granatum]|uniref:Uncharacterized protein n=1 Tax=Punica granatum TaxID=22663 RepID=A0A2I0KIY1_PUNGR|nr:hypothetical protein CRG98_011147 [Punica granatum]
MNHFLARLKTPRGRPKQKLEESRGCLFLHAQVQSGTPRGISSLTDTRLTHAADRNLKPSGTPDRGGHLTPVQNATSNILHCPSMIRTRNRAIRLFQHPEIPPSMDLHLYFPYTGILPLFTGFGLAFYRYPRASAWQFTAFLGFRPGNLPLSTGFSLAI